MKNRFYQKGRAVLIGEIHPIDSILDTMEKTKDKRIRDKTESVAMQEIEDEMDLIAYYHPHYIFLESTEVEISKESLLTFRTRALAEVAKIHGAELIALDNPYTTSVIGSVGKDLLELDHFISFWSSVYEDYRRLLTNSEYQNKWANMKKQAIEIYKKIEDCAKKLNFVHSLYDRNWSEVLNQEREYFMIEVREEEWARLISKLYRNTPEATMVAIVGRGHIRPNSKLIKYLRMLDIPLKLHDVGKIYEGKL